MPKSSLNSIKPAEDLTLSYWVKSNLTGVYCHEFQNDDGDKTRGANFTISSADTWEKKTITISGDTASGFTNDNNRSMRLSFGLMSGSNYTGTNSSIANWVTRSSNLTSIYANLGVNFCSSTSNYINIAGVQLEAGTSASDFEFLPYDVNLQRCQRYYYKHDMNGTAGPRAQQYQANYRMYDDWFPTTMRTFPTSTVTYSRQGDTGTPSAFNPSTTRFQAYTQSDYDSTSIDILTAANYSAEL